MGIYLIPIFCFGLVITGIVFLGVQQASDLAKQLQAQRNEAEPVTDKSSGATPKIQAARLGHRPT